MSDFFKKEPDRHDDAKAKNVMGMPRVPLAAFGGAEFPEFAWPA